MSVKLALGRDGNRLRISITESRTGTTFYFDNTSAGDAAWAAMLLFDKLNDGVAQRIQEARAAAYRAGWKDAKAKKPKRDWFSNCINQDGDDR